MASLTRLPSLPRPAAASAALPESDSKSNGKLVQLKLPEDYNDSYISCRDPAELTIDLEGCLKIYKVPIGCIVNYIHEYGLGDCSTILDNGQEERLKGRIEQMVFKAIQAGVDLDNYVEDGFLELPEVYRRFQYLTAVLEASQRQRILSVLRASQRGHTREQMEMEHGLRDLVRRKIEKRIPVDPEAFANEGAWAPCFVRLCLAELGVKSSSSADAATD